MSSKTLQTSTDFTKAVWPFVVRPNWKGKYLMLYFMVTTVVGGEVHLPKGHPTADSLTTSGFIALGDAFLEVEVHSSLLLELVEERADGGGGMFPTRGTT